MISDDDLLLYHYRDGLNEAERARVGAALAEQPELAQRYHQMVARLDAAAAAMEVPVPLSFERRWRAALAQEEERKAERSARIGRLLFNAGPWYALAAGIFTAVCALWMLTSLPRTQVANNTVTTPAPATHSAYERGLTSHLASTERQLVTLQNASPEERAKLVESMIEQNRVYALAAERAGEPQLARVLRAFTPVLESLLQESGDTSSSVDQLEFELRALQGRLGAGKADKTRSTI